MEHLTGEEVVEYMKIDEDNYTKTDAGLMNKVYDHLSECDICYEAFYKTKRFHSMAELFTGEPIPLGRKRISLLAALKLGDVTGIVDAALHRILDTVDNLSDSIHDIYSQLLSRGFALAEGFQAELAPSMPGVKGEDQEPDQIIIDDTTQSIIMISDANGGFDFLGCTITKTSSGVVIEPLEKSVRKLKKKLLDEIKKHVSSPADIVTKRLDLITRGWSNYYQFYDSEEAFNRIDQSARALLKHYGMPDEIEVNRYKASKTPKIKYIPIVTTKNPFEKKSRRYFKKRQLLIAECSYPWENDCY